jgi:hypothetical protein
MPKLVSQIDALVLILCLATNTLSGSLSLVFDFHSSPSFAQSPFEAQALALVPGEIQRGHSASHIPAMLAEETSRMLSLIDLQSEGFTRTDGRRVIIKKREHELWFYALIELAAYRFAQYLEHDGVSLVRLQLSSEADGVFNAVIELFEESTPLITGYTDPTPPSELSLQHPELVDVWPASINHDAWLSVVKDPQQFIEQDIFRVFFGLIDPMPAKNLLVRRSADKREVRFIEKNRNLFREWFQKEDFRKKTWSFIRNSHNESFGKALARIIEKSSWVADPKNIFLFWNVDTLKEEPVIFLDFLERFFNRKTLPISKEMASYAAEVSRFSNDQLEMEAVPFLLEAADSKLTRTLKGFLDELGASAFALSHHLRNPNILLKAESSAIRNRNFRWQVILAEILYRWSLPNASTTSERVNSLLRAA